MLGGVDPVIIFQTSALGKSPFSGLSGVPVLGDALPVTGFPIPIYLGEKLTGIYVETESVSVDVATDLKYTDEGDLVDNQQAAGSSLTVNLVARRNAPLLSVILTFVDMCLTRAVGKKYKITYVNGPIAVFNGLIESFSQQSDRNTDLVRMQLTLTRGKASSVSERLPNPISASVGATPSLVGVLP